MSNKVVIVLIAFLFLIMIGLTGGLFMIWAKLNAATVQANNAATPNGQAQELHQAIGVIFPMDTFIVNLADGDGKRYLRITMDLELAKGTVADDLKKRLPQMRDNILTLLPSKRFEDIRTVEGKTSLRNEIIANLNGLFGRESISDIYFTEFVVQ